MHVLSAAIDVHDADAGMVQLVDGELSPSVVAEQGLSAAFVTRASAADPDQHPAAWQRALRSQQIVQDVDTRPDAASSAPQLDGGFGAVQSVPLINRDGSLVGALTIYFRSAHPFGERDAQLGTVLGQQAAELIETRRQQLEAAASRMAAGEVRELLRRLVVVQEEERRRIARDLHDQMGQQLTALRLSLELLGGQPANDAARGLVVQAQDLAEEIDRSVDFLTWELRPASLEQMGLPQALGDLVKMWSERFHVPVECHCEGPSREISTDIAVHLYRIVQEALHNIHKHAAATRATVALETRARTLLLTVEDNGHGFDPDATSGRGLGLVNIRERAALIDAELEIDSEPGQGTTIFVRVPLDADPNQLGRRGSRDADHARSRQER